MSKLIGKALHSLSAPDIIAKFRSGGIRVTKLREGLVGILVSAEKPLSVPELLATLSNKKITVNKTSVYRELEFFIAEKIISEVDFLQGAKRYEVVSQHHHHLVCSHCDHVSCVDACVDLKAFYSTAKKIGFTVDSHVLEFFGRCENCQQAFPA